MTLHRRDFVKKLAALAPIVKNASRFPEGATMMTSAKYDFAIIGAGVFGAWTAYQLRLKGKKVALLDAYGPGNSRASSGGESRVIRMGYGADEVYTKWSIRALSLWQEFFNRTGQPLFHRTGVLWMAHEKDDYVDNTLALLQKHKVAFEKLSRTDLEKRFPQITFGPVRWGLFEPNSGALLARRAVQAVVHEAVKNGVEYLTEAVAPPAANGPLAAIDTRSGVKLAADTFIFACGPWLPKLFPDLLGNRIHPTRQEVFFFGTPPGDRRYSPPLMPAWIDFGDEIYGIPDLENRGFKVAPDRHGPAFDPDSGTRVVSSETIEKVRALLAERFPGLKDAPLIESRVCQYENTSNGDFLIDHHPEMKNVLLVGGGSGHGFKHGPALGEYVAELLTGGGSAEPRFSLATKKTVQHRTVH
jgi:monomeric sarcosine oxidase